MWIPDKWNKTFWNCNLNEIKNVKSVSILIGPEGGLSEKEIEILENQNFKRLSLGKRILRTETAAVAALAMINMVIEQWKIYSKH